MSDAAPEARRLALIRVERAAGTAFGCEDEAQAAPARAPAVPAALALALAATFLASALAWLV